MIRRNIIARFRYLLWCSDLEATRFTLGLSALLWAILLAWPGTLFPSPDEIAVGRGRMTYAIMAQIMPEEWWAILWAAQGLAMLWSLFYGCRNLGLLIIDGVLGVFLWTVCVISSFSVYWPKADFWTALLIYKPPAAMAGEVGLMFASWWVLIRYKCAEKNCG